MVTATEARGARSGLSGGGNAEVAQRGGPYTGTRTPWTPRTVHDRSTGGPPAGGRGRGWREPV